MATRALVKWPNKLLQQACRPIESVGKPEQRLFHDLVDTMRAEDGVGIAAPQVGVLRMMFVIGEPLLDQPTCFINPWVPHQSLDGDWDYEYCLSFPSGTARVWRPKKLMVTARDLNFEEFNLEAQGLLARCVLHEYDHLTGRVLADYGLLPRS